ncbi:MAG: hypothetical protein HOE90_24110 [Bacteriovoracaceae bacterium]|nr:hypothetical protein [Bacteriovoracaceae bacterium]
MQRVKHIRNWHHSVYIVLTALCFSSLYSATTDMLGADPRSMILGQSNRFSDPGVGAAQGNPAFIARDKKLEVSLGLSYARPNLHNADRTNVAQTTSGIKSDPYQADKAADLKWTSFSLVIPLSSWLGIGVSGSLPIGHLARMHAFTGHESTYLHYNERQSRPEVFTAISSNLPWGFSMGAGIFHSFLAEGQMQLAASDTDADARMLMELKPSYIPYAGLGYTKEIDQQKLFKMGAFYRAASKEKSEIVIDTSFNIAGVGTFPLSAGSEMIAYYDPETFAFGASYKSSTFAIHNSVIRSMWSHYKAPVIGLLGKDLSDLTGGKIVQDSITLDDTWSFQLGGEFFNVFNLFGGSVHMASGLEFHESALPDKPTSLAVVDSERYVVNLGSTLRFESLGSAIEHPVDFIFGFKYSQYKKENLKAYNSGAQTQSGKIGGHYFAALMGVKLEL